MVTEAEEKVHELEKQVTDLKGRLTATDMFTLIDRESKHKTMLIVVLMICWLLTIAGFIWYLTLPTEEYEVYVDQDTSDNSNANYIGGDYNVSTPKDN